ncbi:MAG: cob(I)yrinic acid a,c-diamide adenosyltransferase [Candidatus Saccharimonadaceae bacterium]
MGTTSENTTQGPGLIHVYTGTGKGKTTAAIGLTARALGSGLSVCYCSFHKDPEKYGYTEMDSLKKLGAHVINFAKYHPHMDNKVNEATIATITKEVNEATIATITKEVNEAMDTITTLFTSIHFDMLILDEIFISVRDNYLEEEKLIDFIKNKPKATELVLTGRGATTKILSMADYITDFVCIKHPYYKKMHPRKGIEY